MKKKPDWKIPKKERVITIDKVYMAPAKKRTRSKSNDDWTPNKPMGNTVTKGKRPNKTKIVDKIKGKEPWY